MNYYPSTTNENPSGAPQRKMEIDVFAKFDFHKYANYEGKDLFKRIQHWGDFINELKKYKLFLYSRRTLSPPGTECYGMDEYGDVFYGLNFASADYLGLSQSSLSKEAAQKAAEEYGVNSCGSPLAFGAHKYYYQLMAELQEFWGFKHVILYSAGWLAGFGVIKGLIKTNDHVIMDELSHNCLTEGAKAATKNVYRVKHLCNKSMEAKIKEVREQNPNNAILVVTEGLFSMDADTTDIPELQQICKKYEAFLLIDSAHDFGCMGPTGKGCWEGLKDFSNVILMSGGSKCLSTNLGWVACNNECVTEFLKVSSSAYMFTNAVNPVQCATALAQLRILKSETGKRIREKCIENYKYTRKRLEDLGIECRGNPCPILIVMIGNEIVSRLVARLMMDEGVHVNGIEYPIVKQGEARLRVNLMPQHDKKNLDLFVDTLVKVLEKANTIFNTAMEEYQKKLETQQSKL